MIDMFTIIYLSFLIILPSFSFMVSLLWGLINESFTTTTIIIIKARAGTTASIITATT